MNKLPTKQIYLLFIIVVGIIALSVYSTYALFTFEKTTSDIVSIHIPKSLTVSEDIYEYQQIVVAPNTVVSTDIDVYNAYEYEMCFSIWYKVLGDSSIQNNVQVFEKSNANLTSSGIIEPSTNKRVTLIIINDNDKDIKINIGTAGSQKKDGVCSLNISDDKLTISTYYDNAEILATRIIETTSETDIEENYLTYTKENINFNENDIVYVSDNFTYKTEIFTLENAKQMTFKELLNNNENDIYLCKENNNCSILYKINTSNIKKEDNNYIVSEYNKLIGYSQGTNGLRKINNTDYVFYGDNPNNFIYFNCTNDNDLSTCELWRIIGIFYNKEKAEYNTKIIRNDTIGLYNFDNKNINGLNKSSNIWSNSTLYKYLNEEYKINNKYNNYLEYNKYKPQVINSIDINIDDISTTDTTITSKFTIPSILDFVNTSSCQKNKINEYTKECLTNNWLNNKELLNEWTSTSKELVNDTKEENIATKEEINQSTEPVDTTQYITNYAYAIGENIHEADVNNLNDVRPVALLKYRIIITAGNGTFDSPYIVK